MFMKNCCTWISWSSSIENKSDNTFRHNEFGLLFSNQTIEPWSLFKFKDVSSKLKTFLRKSSNKKVIFTEYSRSSETGRRICKKRLRHESGSKRKRLRNVKDYEECEDVPLNEQGNHVNFIQKPTDIINVVFIIQIHFQKNKNYARLFVIGF